MKPSVSVIIPCFNAEPFLRATIESALSQTAPPDEVIVVDDASTDGSVAVARSFGAAVHVIEQRNQGPAVARNTGAAASTGRFLMFLDADDLLAHESLERLTAAAAGTPRTVSLMESISFRGNPPAGHESKTSAVDAFLPYILVENLGNPICHLTPRELFDEVGGFCDGTGPFEDWDFWAQVALTGAHLRRVPYAGGLYRIHDASIMRTIRPDRRALGHVRVIERLARTMLARPDLVAAWGQPMFWSAWNAIQHARSTGIRWRELAGLRASMHALIRLGPPSIRSSRYALTARYLGIPIANALNDLVRIGRPSSDARPDPVGVSGDLRHEVRS